MADTTPAQRVAEVCADLQIDAPDDFIFIDTVSQSLTYYKKSAGAVTYAVSTSQFGIGNREGSYMTPPGLHRIEEKIGGGAKPRAVFRSREDTGTVWSAGMDGENQILSRIMRLRGLEAGVNAGQGIDSYDRYIYIHGTNNEEMIGTPMSHGCVCMKNDDVIRLFDMVETGTMVYISGDGGRLPRQAEKPPSITHI
jgi:UDP-N-acetylmuramate--alanine ligase